MPFHGHKSKNWWLIKALETRGLMAKARSIFSSGCSLFFFTTATGFEISDNRSADKRWIPTAIQDAGAYLTHPIRAKASCIGGSPLPLLSKHKWEICNTVFARLCPNLHEKLDY